jgi:hypothetical protein
MKMPSGLLLERNPQVDSLSFTYWRFWEV